MGGITHKFNGHIVGPKYVGFHVIQVLYLNFLAPSSNYMGSSALGPFTNVSETNGIATIYFHGAGDFVPAPRLIPIVFLTTSKPR